MRWFGDQIKSVRAVTRVPTSFGPMKLMVGPDFPHQPRKSWFAAGQSGLARMVLECSTRFLGILAWLFFVGSR